MAADINDKFTDAFNSANPNVAKVTSPRTSGTATLACDNLSGWPTSTAVHFSTYKIDTSNNVVAGTQTDWKGIVSGNNIGTLTRKAGAADNGNAIGDIVEMNPTGSWAHDLVQGILVHSNEDGTLKDGIITSAKVGANAILSGLLGLSSGYTGGVASQANAGTAGGTMYYINLGGIKILWAIGTSSQSSNATGTNQPTFTLPTSFFSTIQGAIGSPVACTNSAAQSTPIISSNTTTVTVACIANSGTSTTQQPSILVIGT